MTQFHSGISILSISSLSSLSLSLSLSIFFLSFPLLLSILSLPLLLSILSLHLSVLSLHPADATVTARATAVGIATTIWDLGSSLLHNNYIGGNIGNIRDIRDIRDMGGMGIAGEVLICDIVIFKFRRLNDILKGLFALCL